MISPHMFVGSCCFYHESNKEGACRILYVHFFLASNPPLIDEPWSHIGYADLVGCWCRACYLAKKTL